MNQERNAPIIKAIRQSRELFRFCFYRVGNFTASEWTTVFGKAMRSHECVKLMVNKSHRKRLASLKRTSATRFLRQLKNRKQIW